MGIVIESQEGKFLFGKRISSQSYGDMWVVVGGGVEKGEREEAAIRREVLEETGIDLSKNKIIKVFGDLKGETEKTLRTGERVLCKMDFTDFRVKLTDESNKIKCTFDPMEFSEIRWFYPEEIKELTFSAGSAALLNKIKLLNKQDGE